ncbi:hypothetical protein Ancab_015125 [Ancistrocladus abbreviatus]
MDLILHLPSPATQPHSVANFFHSISSFATSKERAKLDDPPLEGARAEKREEMAAARVITVAQDAGTFGCGAVIVEGGDFIAKNITLEKSAPQVLVFCRDQGKLWLLE